MAESRDTAAQRKEGQDSRGDEQGQQPERQRGGQAMETQTNRGAGQSLQRRGGSAPSLWHSSPFEFARRMTEEMDRVFDRMFDDFGFERRSLLPRGLFGGVSSGRQQLWAPRIEAFQKQDKYVVRAELPGVKKEDVEIHLTDETLTIQGQRRHEQEEEREGVYVSERAYGSFYREIQLPDGVITDSAQAAFRDGILEVTMQAPPDEVRRGRRLEIQERSDDRR